VEKTVRRSLKMDLFYNPQPFNRKSGYDFPATYLTPDPLQVQRSYGMLGKRSGLKESVFIMAHDSGAETY